MKTNAKSVLDTSEPTLRISPAVQAQIIELYFRGYNFVEIGPFEFLTWQRAVKYKYALESSRLGALQLQCNDCTTV